MSGIRRAVFLDRDGVLNRVQTRDGVPYPPASLADFEIFPGVADAILRLKEAGFMLIVATNQRVTESQALMKQLYDQKLLSPQPFDERIEFLAFDLWHYFGRTSKHGAFMGGADFVQWHGFYELNVKLAELKKQAEELRAARQAKGKESGGAQRTSHRAG